MKIRDVLRGARALKRVFFKRHILTKVRKMNAKMGKMNSRMNIWITVNVTLFYYMFDNSNLYQTPRKLSRNVLPPLAGFRMSPLPLKARLLRTEICSNYWNVECRLHTILSRMSLNIADSLVEIPVFGTLFNKILLDASLKTQCNTDWQKF